MIQNAGDMSYGAKQICQWVTFFLFKYFDQHHFLKLVRYSLINNILIDVKTRGILQLKKKKKTGVNQII